MSYGSVAGVQALVPEVGTLTAATTPTSDQVTVWLGEAYAKINRALANAGYVTPVSANAALYPELTGLENLYAAAYVLRARGIDTASGEAETPSIVWLREFTAGLQTLALSNLALVGATAITPSATHKRRRIGTVQMRRIDGYSRGRVDDTTPTLGEYTDETAPSE